ncbi:MAG: hypothetical protein HY550_02645 [Elusimicrobia bacterium]|nr:hypothetical protein [Elusimicrobiota bacterium]
MRNATAFFFALALLAGCSGNRKSDSAAGGGSDLPARAVAGARPAFALPGVPLREDAQPAAAEKEPEAPASSAAAAAPEQAAPAEPVAEARPAEDKPAEAAPPAPAAASGDLDFHLAAAGKYSVKKKYRSAAAEYGAALGFIPAGDARAVHALERQGAMLLRAGDEPGAKEYFLSAISRAGELGTSGKDLSNAYLGLGYCLEKAHKVKDAIGSYEKARRLASGKKARARISRTINDLKKAAK